MHIPSSWFGQDPRAQETVSALAEEIGHDLACSACAWTATEVRTGGIAYAGPKWCRGLGDLGSFLPKYASPKNRNLLKHT